MDVEALTVTQIDEFLVDNKHDIEIHQVRSLMLFLLGMGILMVGAIAIDSEFVADDKLEWAALGVLVVGVLRLSFREWQVVRILALLQRQAVVVSYQKAGLPVPEELLK